MYQLQDVAQGLTQLQIQQIKAFFTQCIWDVAKMLRLRSRVAATATVYFRKFYARHSFCSWDPQLVHVGCLYLASKAEECALGASMLANYVKRLLPAWPYDTSHVLDAEMVILQSLDFRLALLSPFQPLAALSRDAALSKGLAQKAWAVLNDSYFSDAPILYPPQLLALGSIVYASALEDVEHKRQQGQQQQQQQQQGVQSASVGGTMGQSSVCASGGTGQPAPNLPAWLQGLQVNLAMVYAVVEELAQLYSNATKRINPDECVRLLHAIGAQTQQAGLPLASP